MRLTICGYCDGGDNGHIAPSRKIRGSTIEVETAPPLTEQPRGGESIPLEIMAKPSTQTPDQRLSIKISSNSRESSFTSTSNKAVAQLTTPLSVPLTNILSSVSATSNFNYIAKNGKQSNMTFEQVQPEYFQGTYKGSQFTIKNGKLHSANDAYSQLDRELILKNYSQATLAMQQGMIGIEATLLGSLNQKLPSFNLRQLSELTTPAGSKININFTAENGEKSKMTFKQIKPGLFRGAYNNKEFSIANGQILTLDGADHNLNRELILDSFYRALLGMQQTKLGLQHGEWAIEAKLPGSQLNPMELLKAACPERRNLYETESLQVHNEFRKIHGVPPLTHSEFLCEMAREWAEHLALKDTSYKRPNNKYGENLHYSNGVVFDVRAAITAWYDEINLYDYNDPEFSKETGHFTQLVWKDTKQLGTGVAQLGDKVWLCCYYHPPGNVLSKFSHEFVPRPTGSTVVT